MLQERLNDAAIALYNVLSENQVLFGIFGGYAIAAYGGLRESKDVDCLAAISKEQVIQLVHGRHGFTAVSLNRLDYVGFQWSDTVDKKNPVMVKVFCEQFSDARFTMQGVLCIEIPVQGLTLGHGVSSFLPPFYIFRGKLRTAAMRNKYHDSADIRMLARLYGRQIRERAHEVNLEYVGLAIKRYPELEWTLLQLGIDVEAGKEAVKDVDISKLPSRQPGDVQRSFLSG